MSEGIQGWDPTVAITNQQHGYGPLIGTMQPNGGVLLSVGDSAGARARTDHSGTITLGGMAQNVFTAGQSANGFVFQNLSTSVMYIRSDGNAASAGAGSLYIAPNGYYEPPTNAGAPTSALSVFCATTGAAYTCMTF